MSYPPSDDPDVLIPESDADPAEEEGPAETLCPACSGVTIPGASFCPQCGAALTDPQPAPNGASAVAMPTDPTDRPPSKENAEDLASEEEGEQPRSRLLLTAAAIVVVVALLAVGAIVLAQRTTDKPKATGPTSPTTSVPVNTADWVTFTDPIAGFSVRYPPFWPVVEGGNPPKEPLIDFPRRLLLDAGGLNSALVRTNDLEVTIGPDNLADLKALTDEILKDPGLLVLSENQVQHKDLIGYYYVYTFTDTATNQRGAHLHYFLVKDKRMYMLVFQIMPTDGASRLEPIFNEILLSFTAS